MSDAYCPQCGRYMPMRMDGEGRVACCGRRASPGSGRRQLVLHLDGTVDLYMSGVSEHESWGRTQAAIRNLPEPTS